MSEKKRKIPPKQSDKQVLRAYCDDGDFESTEDCHEVPFMTWVDQKGNRRYSCKNHGIEWNGRDSHEKYEEDWHPEIIRFDSKDMMRLHARRLAREKILTGTQRDTYMLLIDMMWTGDEGTETPGNVMNRYASIDRIAKDANHSWRTIENCLSALDALGLIFIDYNDTRRKGSARGVEFKSLRILSIHLKLYQVKKPV